MLTSIEIAKLLKEQQKSKKKKIGFDKGLVGLGIAFPSKKSKAK